MQLVILIKIKIKIKDKKLMTSLLEQNQIDYFIKKNPSWLIDNKTIKKEFKFDNK